MCDLPSNNQWRLLYEDDAANNVWNDFSKMFIQFMTFIMTTFHVASIY